LTTPNEFPVGSINRHDASNVRRSLVSCQDPRRAQVLQDIDPEIEAIAYAYALVSSPEEEEEHEEELEDLLDVREAIISN